MLSKQFIENYADNIGSPVLFKEWKEKNGQGSLRNKNKKGVYEPSLEIISG